MVERGKLEVEDGRKRTAAAWMERVISSRSS